VNGYLPGILTFLARVGAATVGEFLSEEVRDRLDQVPPEHQLPVAVFAKQCGNAVITGNGTCLGSGSYFMTVMGQI
jgi:hypothetical protein